MIRPPVRTPGEAVAAIRDEIAHTGGRRACLVHVSAPAPLRSRLEAAVRAELGPGAKVVQVRNAPRSAAELAELNRGRDMLLAAHRAIVFVVTSGEEARMLHRRAPDLTASLDLRLELAPALDRPWPELRRALRDAMRERHRVLDLTGLVPGSADVVRLPLERIFMRSGGLRGPEDDGAAQDPLGAIPEGASLLLAPPGRGKTTALRHLAGNTGDDPLVLFAPLADYAVRCRDRVVPLLDHLQLYFGRVLGAEGEVVPLGEHLDEVVLLLDGLDELPDAGLRRRVVTDAAHIGRRARVLVSARDHVTSDLRESDLRRWARLRLGEPSEHDIVAFVRAVLEARRGTGWEARRRAERLAGRILAEPDLRELARTPLLLTFLVILADLGRDLPDQRTLLYRELVEMLIGSWRRLRSPEGDPRPLGRAEVLRVVAPLGWWLVRQGGGGVGEYELLDALTRIEARREPDPEAARRAAQRRLGQLGGDTALLRTDGSWRFTHPTLAEFLAAYAVLQDEKCLDELSEDPYWPGWSQVLPFALALATDVEVRDEVARRIAHALLTHSRRPGRYDARYPRTLAAVLGEVRSLPESADRALAARAIEITLRNRLAPAAAWDAQAAVLDIAHRVRPGIARALADWLCPPRKVISWGHVAQAWPWWGGAVPQHFSDRLLPWGALLPPVHALPERLRRLDLDPVPLLATWLAHGDPAVRALGWNAGLRPVRARLDRKAAYRLRLRGARRLLESCDAEVAAFWRGPWSPTPPGELLPAWLQALRRVHGEAAAEAWRGLLGRPAPQGGAGAAAPGERAD